MKIPHEGGYMDDEEDDGYRSVRVEHDGPSIYTDSGFAEEISGLVGFPSRLYRTRHARRWYG